MMLLGLHEQMSLKLMAANGGLAKGTEELLLTYSNDAKKKSSGQEELERTRHCSPRRVICCKEVKRSLFIERGLEQMGWLSLK